MPEPPRDAVTRGFDKAWEKFKSQTIPTWGPNAAKTFFEAGMLYQRELSEGNTPAEVIAINDQPAAFVPPSVASETKEGS